MKRAGRKQETNAPRAQASARPVRPIMQTHEGAVSSIATRTRGCCWTLIPFVAKATRSVGRQSMSVAREYY
jgi:hypothetical protein